MNDGEFIDKSEPPHKKRDVFVFFDNTDKRRAPDDARTLMAKLNKSSAG